MYYVYLIECADKSIRTPLAHMLRAALRGRCVTRKAYRGPAFAAGAAASAE